MTDQTLEREVIRQFELDGKIAAIKLYRAERAVGLKEAKEAVEEIIERLQVKPPEPERVSCTIEESKYILLKPIAMRQLLKEDSICNDELLDVVKYGTSHAPIECVNVTCSICPGHFEELMQHIIKERKLNWLDWLSAKQYIKQEKVNGLKVDDWVRVVKKTDWDGWVESMNKQIGKVLRVTETERNDWGKGYVRLSDTFNYPVSVLTKTTKPNRVGDPWEMDETDRLQSDLYELVKASAELNDRNEAGIAWKAVRILMSEYDINKEKL